MLEKFEIIEKSKYWKYSKTRIIQNIRKIEIFEIFEKLSTFSKNIRNILENCSKNSRIRIFEYIRKFTLIRNEYFRNQDSNYFEYFRTRNYFVDTLGRPYTESVTNKITKYKIMMKNGRLIVVFD